MVGIVNEPRDVGFAFNDLVCDGGHGGPINNEVPDPKAKAAVEEPEVDQLLNSGDKLHRYFRALLAEHDMDKTALCDTDGLLVHSPEEDLPVLDPHPVIQNGIGSIHPVVRATGEIDAPRDNETEYLFAGPQRLGFNDGGHRHYAIPLRNPKEDILDLIPVQKRITQGKLADTQK
jgi:hypothetical protein